MTTTSTATQLRPAQLIPLLRAAIEAREPILIQGAPGIGKTDLVKQAAADVNADLLLSHPGVEDPTTPGGFPWMDAGAKTATFKPFGVAHKAQTARKKTVWFLDDFGQALPAVQANYMQWLLARECNGQRLSDHTTFLVATNRRIDRANVSGILEPVKSRFITIVELVAHIDDWSAWAMDGGKVPVEIVAFLRFRPDLLCKFEPSADLTNSPLPRTWAAAGRVLQLGLPEAIERAALAGAVGEGAATEFLGFRNIYRQLPNIDGILVDPDAATIPTSPGALFAVVTGLAVKTTPTNFGRAARYAERLAEAQKGEFATLYVKDAIRKVPAVQETPAFVKLTSGALGQLMTGATK